MSIRSIALTSTLVCAFVTGADAQRADAPRSTQQPQVQGVRQAPASRLIVPIVGTRFTSSPQQFQTRGPVTGSFSIQRFAQTTAGDVAAVGVLTLNLTDPASGTPRTIVTESAIRVVQSGDESSSLASTTRPAAGTSAVMLTADSRVAPTVSPQPCETLSLALRPVQLDILGMAVRLDQMNVDFVSRTTGQLRNQLCGTRSVMDRSISPAERTNRLNALLDVVG